MLTQAAYDLDKMAGNDQYNGKGNSTAQGYDNSRLKEIIEKGLRQPRSVYTPRTERPTSEERPVGSGKVIPLRTLASITEPSDSLVTTIADYSNEPVPKQTLAKAVEPATTKPYVIGGEELLPADHVYDVKTKEGREAMNEMLDQVVLAHSITHGLDVSPVANQDGAMARVYAGDSVVQDVQDFEAGEYFETRVPVFLKAITGGNFHNYVEEAKKHHNIASRAKSAVQLYSHTVLKLSNGVGVPLLEMERIDGENMERYMQARPKLMRWYEATGKNERKENLRQILTIFKKMVDATDEVHDAGYVHRDIKPNNFMIESETGNIRILDFGAALRQGEDPHNTEGFIGTPHYCSPEHVIRQANPQMDVYSLGCILYEFITGQPPHIKAASQLVDPDEIAKSPNKDIGRRITDILLPAMLHGEKYQNPEADASLQEMQDICDELRFIVEHSTAPHADKRFENCNALSNAIEAVIDKIQENQLFSNPVKSCSINEDLYKPRTGEHDALRFDEDYSTVPEDDIEIEIDMD